VQAYFVEEVFVALLFLMSLFWRNVQPGCPRQGGVIKHGG